MDDIVGLCHQFFSLTASNNTNVDNLWLDLVIIFILILINGFFSASEMALVTLNDTKINKMAEDGNPTAKKIKKFIDNPGSFLATIQVGVTLAGFLSSALAAEKFSRRLSYLIGSSYLSTYMPWIQSLSTIIVTLIMSYLSLVLGELVPKRIGMYKPEAFSKVFVGVLSVVDIILKPFTRLLNFSSNIILKLLRIPTENSDKIVTEEQIRMMVDVSRQSGSIKKSEGEWIQNIFEFNDKEVSEIMTHRTNVVALDVETSFEDAVKFTIEEKYSRFPVYDGDIDKIVGILNIKDLLAFSTQKNPENFSLHSILREPYFIPESKHVDTLLRSMQQERVSMAIAIDEYGGTAGIITIEDLLEEIVGNIEDEFDEAVSSVTTIDETHYLLDPMLSLEELNRLLPALTFKEEQYDDFDTLAGLILDVLGFIPEANDQPECIINGMKYKVLEMSDKRIAKVEVELRQLESTEIEESMSKEDF